MSRRRSVLGVAVVAMVALGACGGDDEGGATSVVADTTPTLSEPAPATTDAPTTTEATEATATTDAPATTEAAEAAYPRTVEHALGSTEIPAAPERVIALDMSFVDAVLALDSPLLGYTLYQQPNGSLPGYFGDALELAADAQYVGDLMEPNLEAIAALDPDLIITAAVRHESIYDQLSQIAPTIMSDSAGTGWKDNVRLTGEALGKEDFAEQILAEFEARAAEVGAAINAEHGDPTISVVRFVEPIRLYQRGSFSGVVLDDAGLARPESQQATSADQFIREISPEEIGLADGDHLFYTVFDEGDVDATRQFIAANPLWANLGAVQAGQAYEVPDETWMSAVGLFGAHEILDDLAATFGVDPAR